LELNKNELLLQTLNDIRKMLWQKKASTRADFKTFANFVIEFLFNKPAKKSRESLKKITSLANLMRCALLSLTRLE
jgi:hypothetical protein